MAAIFHPKKDENGNPVRLAHPSQATDLGAWTTRSLAATVIPGGHMPAELHGIPFSSWTEAPRTDEQWAHVKGQHGGLFDEPLFTPTPGKRMAAGVVIEEPDGRVWVIHPSNAFGGYEATFPKGTAGHGVTLQRTAIREAFEESGLKVQITGFLADCERSRSKTRYYLARRVGGCPADMGWESQATSLVPLSMLGNFLTHPNDASLVKALQQEKRPARRDIIKYEFGLSSGHRILAALHGFYRKYGIWPSRLLLERGMGEALMTGVLTSLGWNLMAEKLEIVLIDEGTVIVEGGNGERCDYCIDNCDVSIGPRADEWLWGTRI